MIKTPKALLALALGVAAIATIVCVVAFVPLFGGPPSQRSFVSIRGETVQLEGSGLYRNDSVSFATQAKAQDLVTLFVGVPLLLASLFFAMRGSLRGGLTLAGTFAYFSYTYATYAFGVYYNAFFLAYVALLSMSVAGLILSLSSLNAESLKAAFSGRIVRATAIGFDFFVGSMLLLMWMARILPGLFGGADKSLIEHYTTLPIQVMDLAFVVPLALTAGVALAADAALGYILTGIFLLKGLSLGLALASMIIWAAVAGQPVNPVETAIFAAIIIPGVVLASLYVRAIREVKAA